ncbi:MAG: anti-sigma factor family protein [Gemmatimonadota bacterium]
MNDPIMHPTAETLQGFVEGLLDEGERVVLESHLLGCTECQGEVEQWRALFSLLAIMPQHAPPAGFASRVMAHVTLPDPWYMRLPARVGERVQLLVPKTTRGWAVATACLALPVVFFTALAAWILSKPYITPQGLFTYTYAKAQAIISGIAQGTLSTVLQSDVALFAARGLDTLVNAGAGAAGALFLTLAMATALSAWVLYQNLFRTTTTRENRHYVSYSF